MKCDICKVRPATVHLTEVVNDKMTKLHLCEECARAKGEELQSHFGLTDLLSGLMDFGPAMKEGDGERKTGTKCPVCGMTFYDIQKKGKIGCGKCYEIFSDSLSGLLRKIHGADRHIGKMPAATDGNEHMQRDFVALKKRLNSLVKEEQFEQAAVVRDQIKELESKLSEVTEGKNGSQ